MSENSTEGSAAAPSATPKPRRKKPPTGRPRGRPPKRLEFLVPSELRRTLLAVLSEEMEVHGPGGTRKVSKFHMVISNLVTSAAKGKPTALNQLMKLLVPALEEREKAHSQVMVAEYLRYELEKPLAGGADLRNQVIAHMAAASDKL